MALVGHLAPVIRIHRGGQRMGECRPDAGEAGVQREKVALGPEEFIRMPDGANRAGGYAKRTIDAALGVDHDKTGSRVKAVDRAVGHTLGVAAADARFGHHVGHGRHGLGGDSGMIAGLPRGSNLVARGGRSRRTRGGTG